MKKDTEINELLNDQKTILKKIDNQHQLLLTSESGTDKYLELKKNLGWDDTDKTIKQEYNKILELQQITKENVDKSILNNESIWNYCIKNNYVLVNIKGYKGQIPEELLEAIDNYTKQEGIHLDSQYNVENLFLLCKFTDVIKDNNSSIKKSKRYKKKELPKILLLERTTKGNAYKEDHYKVIFEIGNKTPITNFFNSLFRTHTKTINFCRHWILFGIILTSILLTGLAFTSFGKVTNNSIKWAFGDAVPTILYIFLGILALKIILPNWFEGREGAPCINIHYDSNYTIISKENTTTRWCNTSWLYGRRNFEIYNKNKIRIRVLLGMWIMFFSLLAVSLTIIHINRILLLNKQVIVTVNIDENIQTTKIYKKNSPFTYDVTTKIVDLDEQKG